VTASKGRWYVIGRDIDRDATRMFKLSRITDLPRRISRPGAFAVPADLDLRALARWAEEIAVQDGVTVTGVTWALTEVTKHRITAEAQHNAVRDAVDRATAYARSLGLGTVRPVALADPGMLGDETRSSGTQTAAPLMRGAAAPAGDTALDLKPEDITVSSRVHARFAAS
jgi:uncharacterized protein YggE